MTTLHPFAVCVLSRPGWQIRVGLAVVITLTFVGLPLPIAGLALWFLALPYMAMAENLASTLGEQHRARRRVEGERDGHAACLVERDILIAALEADLARARDAPASRHETEEERLYRQVGLHPRAPAFLLAAARKAYRSRLHPDRHPRHRQQAHDRYVQAEAAFDTIEALRR